MSTTYQRKTSITSALGAAAAVGIAYTIAIAPLASTDPPVEQHALACSDGSAFTANLTSPIQ